MHWRPPVMRLSGQRCSKMLLQQVVKQQRLEQAGCLKVRIRVLAPAQQQTSNRQLPALLGSCALWPT